MWEPGRLTTLWAFTACYRDSFIFITYSKIIVLRRSTAMIRPLLSTVPPPHIPPLPPLLLHSASSLTWSLDHSFLNHSLFSKCRAQVYIAVKISLRSLVLLCYSGWYYYFCCCVHTFFNLRSLFNKILFFVFDKQPFI
jgi:hypothetical protein